MKHRSFITWKLEHLITRVADSMLYFNIMIFMKVKQTYILIFLFVEQRYRPSLNLNFLSCSKLRRFDFNLTLGNGEKS